MLVIAGAGMRGNSRMPILLLLLASAPGGHLPPGHAYRGNMVQNWHLRTPDGTSRRDFGRSLGRTEVREMLQRPNRPLEDFQMGNSARVGFGFVQGRHLGFKLKSIF
jgi:hypothetical protein